MRVNDLFRTATRSIFRSRLRAGLAGAAVVIGSFTLVLTVGVGSGVNAYIATTIDGIGAPSTMEVQRLDTTDDDGLPAYDPDAGTVTGGFIGTQLGISEQQLADARNIPGVLSIEPTVTVAVSYIQRLGEERYSSGLTSPEHDNVFQMSTGTAPSDDSTAHQVALPATHVSALGFGNEEDAIGEEVVFGFTDQAGAEHTVTATVTGVILPSVVPVTVPVGNAPLITDIAETQAIGRPTTATQPIPSASLVFDAELGDEGVTAIKAALEDIGLEGTTVTDRIGTFKAVIDGIVFVLSAFAIIALLAASFGVANTLLMSVQERTREIGLFKALGASGGRIFQLFALEAVAIGLLGAVVGGSAAVLAGTITNNILQDGVLSTLPGLNVYTADPATLGLVLLAILAITFIAGTAPAARAARKDPIEALRYE